MDVPSRKINGGVVIGLTADTTPPLEPDKKPEQVETTKKRGRPKKDSN